MTSDRRRRERRLFFRHPIRFPLSISEAARGQTRQTGTLDISEGGLCFSWKWFLKPGTPVVVSIPVCDTLFMLDARVAWSQQERGASRFRTGVAFIDRDGAFQAKLAEELLHIDRYRKALSRRLRRPVSEHDAAAAWIRRHGKEFGSYFGPARISGRRSDTKRRGPASAG